MDEITVELQKRVGEFLAPEVQRLPTDVPRRSAVEVLTRTVRKGWRTYLVGGFLRDVLVHPHSHWSRDFDIVVEGCSWEELSTVFTDVISGHNRFGGLSLRRWTEVLGKNNAAPQELDFDVWRLEDTWAVRHEALVFSKSQGLPLAADNLREKALRTACKRAGLQRIDWHTLRHTPGTLLHSQGTPLKVAQAQLGHSHMATTLDIYTHASGSAQRDAVNLLEEQLFPNVPKLESCGSIPETESQLVQ